MEDLYMHVETGSCDTKEGWISSYDKEELSERGIDAESAFEQDVGSTLMKVVI